MYCEIILDLGDPSPLQCLQRERHLSGETATSSLADEAVF